VWVHATVENEKKSVISADEKETFKLIYLQFSERLKMMLAGANMLGEDGSANIAVKTMKECLCLHSMIMSGRKHELAQRMVELWELGVEMPTEGPLAATCDIEDGDDLDDGGDDEIDDESEGEIDA
jgi:hypothetical protein